MTTDADPKVIRRRADLLVQNHRDFMKRLIETRARHHLTQAEVAERMGVSQPTVAAFERYDSNPTLATVRRYALAVDALLDDWVIDDCVGRCLGETHADGSLADQARVTAERVATVGALDLYLISEVLDPAWSSMSAGALRTTHDVAWLPTRSESSLRSESPVEWEVAASRPLARTNG